MTRRFGRKSFKETLRGNNAAINYLAISAGRDPPAELLNSIAPKRERAAPKPSGKPREADILREILKMLRKHPLVATVQRRQSGVFKEGDRWVRVGQRGEADISGILKGGCAYAIEVKRPGGKANERQSEFLATVRRAGGLAGVATSAAEAIGIITGVRQGTERGHDSI